VVTCLILLLRISTIFIILSIVVVEKPVFVKDRIARVIILFGEIPVKITSFNFIFVALFIA
jgi:hypothetical protein